MADKESDDWYKDVREKQIKRGSASKDDKDLLALANKLLGGNSQMLVKYNSFPEYEVLKDGKTYRINPETNTAEEVKSTDKLDHEVVNDFAIDAIKDNFTPPGAKDEEYYKINLADYDKDTLENVLKDIKKERDYFNEHKQVAGAEERLKQLDTKEKYAREYANIDTNDNGKIEVDEMADFQKSLDDYVDKNPKGRDDIPVTTRR